VHLISSAPVVIPAQVIPMMQDLDLNCIIGLMQRLQSKVYLPGEQVCSL
jgi:hypothetical protein